ncbi:unnamed protein product [Larinioides sclopetarius]|uniref:Uncharacterized protein n=1 Tax=Larinioides sclopetarius TaxID=280406 RepID=A0AAV2C2U8_9ARAC
MFNLDLSFLFSVVESYDYVFPQNGLVAYKDGKLIGKKVKMLPNSWINDTSQVKRLRCFNSGSHI